MPPSVTETCCVQAFEGEKEDFVLHADAFSLGHTSHDNEDHGHGKKGPRVVIYDTIIPYNVQVLYDEVIWPEDVVEPEPEAALKNDAKVEGYTAAMPDYKSRDDADEEVAEEERQDGGCRNARLRSCRMIC